MVSSEGACAAYYHYAGARAEAVEAGRRPPGIMTGGPAALPYRRSGRLKATTVTLAHGGGGKAMRDLIDDVFVAAFDNPAMGELEDQARLDILAHIEAGGRLAFTTDSFVVDPLVFPGGDIGKLAVCGTVNDLAVGGATPLWLSAAVIIEEGFEVEILRRIAGSMREAADAAGVAIVTGDTKVVGRGGADKLFVTTSGIGVIPPGVRSLAARNTARRLRSGERPSRRTRRRHPRCARRHRAGDVDHERLSTAQRPGRAPS